jgi:hypothetical protein
MTDNGSTSTNDEKNPWAQPSFIIAAAVVGLLIVLGLILAFTGGTESDSPADNGAVAPAAPAEQSRNTSVCGLAPGDQTIPKDPPRAKWNLVGTLAVPRSPKRFGPGLLRANVPSCFAHSPTGALFAMVNLDGALSVVSRRSAEDQVRVLRQIAAASPGRDAAIDSARRNGPARDSAARAQVAGFSLVRYEPASAVVDLAFRTERPGATGYFHLSSTLRWEHGDWKLVFSQAGEPFDSTQQISSLGGYVPWSGV